MMYWQILMICGDMIELYQKDMDCINEKREELMKISKELNGQKKDNLEDSQKFDVIVSDILNILKKRRICIMMGDHVGRFIRGLIEQTREGKLDWKPFSSFKNRKEIF